jgi:hypothetical protein
MTAEQKNIGGNNRKQGESEEKLKKGINTSSKESFYGGNYSGKSLYDICLDYLYEAWIRCIEMVEDSTKLADTVLDIWINHINGEHGDCLGSVIAMYKIYYYSSSLKLHF